MFPARGCVPIFALGSIWGNTLPRAVILCTLPRVQGLYWIIWSLWFISSDITAVASEYQEVHPYSALNIDSAKINTSLIMTRECEIKEFFCVPLTTSTFSINPDYPILMVAYHSIPHLLANWAKIVEGNNHCILHKRKQLLPKTDQKRSFAIFTNLSRFDC